MTSKVFEFLNDSGGNNFTETSLPPETSVRPPVLGEENELQSNGGMSTRSSGSHRSNKSHSSSKSATSNKGEVSHSPAATPRKSNLEKGDCTITTLPPGFDGEDVEAPLGFEPEGSAANSPPYAESGTPPHLKWAENLNYLLEDSEGVSLFKEYLELEQGGSDELQFWFACQGLKRKADTGDVSNIVKVIFKTYVRFDKVKCISKDTKKEIVDRLGQKVKLNQCVFDEAQKEVDSHLRDVSYPAFIKSDLYVQYVNNYAESPKSSHSSGSNSARPVSQSGLLPVLHEDKELASEEFTSSVGVSLSLSASKTPSGPRSDFLSSKRSEAVMGFYTSRGQSSYPAHISYAPVSAQDSELQSLSSDALTDDTVSLTDTSSVDGNMTYSRKRYKKAMKTNALQNREHRTGLHSQIIPRTERAPKDRNIAETDPARFAQLLIEKLDKEVEERHAVAKVEEKLRSLNQVEVVEDESMNKSSAKNTTAAFIPQMLPDEESAESILDQHCSRIWSSSHHTPSRSPGRHSPHAKSPDRINTTLRTPKAKQVQHSATVAAEAAAAATAVGNVSFPRSHHRNKKDASLSKSFDSGMGEEKGLLMRGETHRHIHHHHHHHHSRDLSSKQRLELEQGNSVYWRDQTSFEHSRGRTNTKKGVPRKSSDASSNIDSGISMVYEADSARVVPNWNTPSSDKVMKWMMQSETISGDTGSGSVDTDRSSSTKRSHRYPSTSATSQAHKQSSKSKTGTHLSSRSASMERSSGLLAWAGGTMPNQPFAQDSNMPLPTPPNPTTQLEEAKRRLEESRASAGPVKSKSFAGVPSKEKGRVVPGAGMLPPSHIPSVRTVPTDLDSSANLPDCPTPRPSRQAGSSSQGDSVVVGMYYEQEPIPYRFTLPGRSITLGEIRHLNTKRGAFKYFFKRDSDEFGEGAVFEEIKDDSIVVPMWDGKIVARLQKVD
ncbi:axin-1-like [Littorina saxatilis]|uniref:Axin n=1 Tax=Littorina saxatilis TaxID=31220 RepID=A0AAN9GK59_9CAEN